MPVFPQTLARLLLIGTCSLLLANSNDAVKAQDSPDATKLVAPITEGERVFSIGHSFHVWVPGIVADLARKAGIPGHTQVGISSIGGSRVIQHWDLEMPPDPVPGLMRVRVG